MEKRFGFLVKTMLVLSKMLLKVVIQGNFDISCFVFDGALLVVALILAVGTVLRRWCGCFGCGRRQLQ